MKLGDLEKEEFYSPSSLAEFGERLRKKEGTGPISWCWEVDDMACAAGRAIQALSEGRSWEEDWVDEDLEF